MLDLKELNRQIDSLDRNDANARRDAIRALRQRERAEWASTPAPSVRRLVEALQRQLEKDRHANGAVALSSVRQDVATILGKIGPGYESVIPDLAALLATGVPDPVREAAAIALGNMGPAARSAVGELIAVLKPGCKITLAAYVASALGEIGCADQRVRTAMLGLWAAPIPRDSSRTLVTIALCKLRIDAPGLIQSLTDPWVGHTKLVARHAAVEALSWCSKDTVGVVPALVAALYDEDESTQEVAKRGLERLGVTPAKATQICCQQIEQCQLAQTALRKSGALAVPPLIAMLKNKNPETREKAAKTLGAIGELAAPAASALAGVLKDKDRGVRLSAAKALWNVTKQADEVVPVLVSLLNGKGSLHTDTDEVRRTFLQTVIEALSRIGPLARRAAPALSTMMKDGNRLVRESAHRALQAIQA